MRDSGKTAVRVDGDQRRTVEQFLKVIYCRFLRLQQAVGVDAARVTLVAPDKRRALGYLIAYFVLEIAISVITVDSCRRRCPQTAVFNNHQLGGAAVRAPMPSIEQLTLEQPQP